MRVYCVIMCVYFLIHMILFLVNGRYPILYLPFVGVAGYIIAFILTYHAKTRIARNIIIYYTLWVFLYVYILGWGGGFQNFCFVLLVFVFMTGYASIPAKCMGAAIIGALRIGIYFYTQTHASRRALNRFEVQEFQVLNTIVIFAILIFLVALFSMDSLESEKKLIDYNDRVKEMASVDPLTGLSNRRAVEEFIERQIKDASENQGFLNFAIGDIDFFKKVNDTYGHAAGDDLLKQLAEIFKEYMRDKGRVARWGGEEFLFLFLGMNGDQADFELEELRKKIKKTEFRSGDTSIRVTMTFGMEEYNIGDSYEQAISAADEKLYQGKENGRDQVVF